MSLRELVADVWTGYSAEPIGHFVPETEHRTDRGRRHSASDVSEGTDGWLCELL